MLWFIFVGVEHRLDECVTESSLLLASSVCFYFCGEVTVLEVCIVMATLLLVMMLQLTHAS